MDFERLDPDDYRGGQSDPDGPSRWLDPTIGSSPPRTVTSKRGTGASVLMAAMLGLVDALGWERPRDETVEVADAPLGGDGLVLDYRHLEPLD